MSSAPADSTEERAGRLNRIHTLLTAKSLQRPFRSLRRLLLVASIVIFLAHAAGFSAIIGLASRQGMLSGELKFAGSQKRLCAEAVLFAGIIQASGMGLEAPYISVDEARVQLAKIAADLKSNAEDLLAAVGECDGSVRNGQPRKTPRPRSW